MNFAENSLDSMEGVPARDMEIEQAKRLLRRRGWSYRRAAPLLGVGYQHLSDMLNRRRESRPLLRRIATLPPATP